jgi:hypothetical protein
VWLFSILPSQHGQVLTEAAAVLVVVATLAGEAASAALSVAAFEQRRLSGVHTLPAEVSAGQVPRLDTIMVDLEWQL